MNVLCHDLRNNLNTTSVTILAVIWKPVKKRSESLEEGIIQMINILHFNYIYYFPSIATPSQLESLQNAGDRIVSKANQLIGNDNSNVCENFMSERLFSTAGKIFSPERYRLKDNRFEQLMFNRCNNCH